MKDIFESGSKLKSSVSGKDQNPVLRPVLTPGGLYRSETIRVKRATEQAQCVLLPKPVCEATSLEFRRFIYYGYLFPKGHRAQLTYPTACG